MAKRADKVEHKCGNVSKYVDNRYSMVSTAKIDFMPNHARVQIGQAEKPRRKEKEHTKRQRKSS